MDKEKMDVRELTEKELEKVSGGSSIESTPKPTHEPPTEKRK